MSTLDLEPMMSSVRQNYGTPQPFFRWVNACFNFDVDVCAEAWSAKTKHYFTKATNGLAQSWRELCWWDNCQYDEVDDWLPYSQHEAIMGGAGVNLVASRPDARWFRGSTESGMGALMRSYFVPQTRVWWMVWQHLIVGVYNHHKRLAFDVPPGTLNKKGQPVKVESAPFPSSLIIHVARASRRKVSLAPARRLWLPGSTKPALPDLTYGMPE